MFDAMLTLACEEALDREYEEAKAYAEANPVIPSEDFHKRMEKLIRSGAGKQHKFESAKRVYNAYSKVAAILLVLVVSLSLTAFAVEPVRVGLLNVLLEVQDEYTSLRMNMSGGGSDGKDPVVPWTNAYKPTYVPEGYFINSINITSVSRSIDYTNGREGNIFYTEYHSADRGVNLDTENAVVENVTIHGFGAMLVSKEGVVSIAWSDGERLFLIESQLSREELLKFAEGVRIVIG